jgi:hypothetical protein
MAYLRKLKMRTKLLAVSFAAAASFANLAHAASDWYSGQTGQYHQLPYSQDTQPLTLVAGNQGACQAKGSAWTFYAIDENGKRESIPFYVPGNTVFVVTDAIFIGKNTGQFVGGVPWLNIFPYSAINAWEKASFLASGPLTGKLGETFSGQGSLVSGATFATGSLLCAKMGFGADGGASYVALEVQNVVVHGTLIDNTRTNTFPYLTW